VTVANGSAEQSGVSNGRGLLATSDSSNGPGELFTIAGPNPE